MVFTPVGKKEKAAEKVSTQEDKNPSVSGFAFTIAR